MISVKNGRIQLKGSTREILGEVFGMLASPNLLNVVMEYKEETEKLKEVTKDLLKIGKLVGENKESCEVTKLLEAQLEISDFLIKTVMEAISIGERSTNANRV